MKRLSLFIGLEWCPSHFIGQTFWYPLDVVMSETVWYGHGSGLLQPPEFSQNEDRYKMKSLAATIKKQGILLQRRLIDSHCTQPIKCPTTTRSGWNLLIGLDWFQVLASDKLDLDRLCMVTLGICCTEWHSLGWAFDSGFEQKGAILTACRLCLGCILQMCLARTPRYWTIIHCSTNVIRIGA